jgi:hypothetical protein
MITRWVREDWETVGNNVNIAQNKKMLATSTISRSGNDDIAGNAGLNITVMPAIGGRIITFRHYDRRKDDNQFRHYVIPEDMDFERELGKMITLESMRG